MIAVDEGRDGPCEICAAHQAGLCDRCSGSIEGPSYQSIGPSHFHLVPAPVLAMDLRAGRGIHDEICHSCYLEDYKESYGTLEGA